MTKQTLSDPIALRIPLDILSDLEAVAETTERSRSWVIVRALKTYLLNEGADILAYRKGLQDVAAGDVAEFDAVLDDMSRIASEKVA